MIFLPVKFCWILFSGFDKNKMAAPASDKLRYFRILPWKHWTEFNETWQEARSQRPLPSFFSTDRKNKIAVLASDWLRHFRHLPETTERNSTKLDGKLDLNVLYQFVFVGLTGKTTWTSWSLIGWDISDSSSETTERNSTKLDRKQDLSVLFQLSLCFFRADQKSQESDWLSHFRLLLWNRWAEFNKLR